MTEVFRFPHPFFSSHPGWKWLILGNVLMGAAMSALDVSIVNVAMPTLKTEYGYAAAWHPHRFNAIPAALAHRAFLEGYRADIALFAVLAAAAAILSVAFRNGRRAGISGKTIDVGAAQRDN